MTTGPIKRVIWIVLDGVGAGEAPDADQFGDLGSNTLGNLASAFFKKSGRYLQLPHLQRWGIGTLVQMEGIEPLQPGEGEGAYGRAQEISQGKDTTTGHWEMAGLILEKPFRTFPNGFPEEIVAEWVSSNRLAGVLGNCVASGTEIIKQYGEAHLETGKPILYTSADSVWQVAAHETIFGLDRLYSICKSARSIADRIGIGRVIARPFVGNPKQNIPFQRTYHRKDLAQPPFGPTYLDALIHAGVKTFGIGKISSIFAGKGILENRDTQGNADGIKVLIEQIKRQTTGLIFCNLIDFDMLYGHRRDVEGFGRSLEEFDRAIPEVRSLLNDEDLLLITSDHGNDPTYRGTDHTREYMPLIAFAPRSLASRPSLGAINLNIRKTFADVGATIAQALIGKAPAEYQLAGESFLSHVI